MNNLIIQQTKSTPRVEFSSETGILSLSGSSYPENAYAFYKPLFDWLNQEAAAMERDLLLKIDLKYLNTSSTKCLMNIIQILEAQRIPGRKVKVEWYYDQGNDTVLEVAQEFQYGIKLDFTVVEK